jgi:large subunit ribosomal protein L24e
MSSARKCSFCGRDFPIGRGIMFVKTDGTLYWFCSSKCRKSMLILKRDPRRMKWISKRKEVD